jgi:Fe-S-cluster-containing hydrogenase component 2
VERDDETGAVLIDRNKCTGCGLCAKYCYFGVIRLSNEEKKAEKCDLCGGSPACVRECPTGALELVYSGGGDNND